MKRQGVQFLYSVNTFVAAMIALYIGFALGLPRPYWAMTTAYTVSQPLSGALRSRAIYRIFGTVLGACFALLAIPPLANAPTMLSLALALWIGVCLYLSLLDRTPRSHVFMLAGYTAAIVGFPVAPAPIGIFDVVVSRLEEIGLGVTCATVIHSLVFPQAVGPALSRRILDWLNDARSWALGVLGGQNPAQNDHERRKLAADITDIRILSTHLPFDTSNLRETSRAMRALQDRMSVLLPLLSAAGDRLSVLRTHQASSEALEAAISAIGEWLADSEGDRANGDALVSHLETLAPELGPGATWRDLLLQNLISRLEEFIRAIEDIRDLRRSIQAGARRLPSTLDRRFALRGGAALHRDHYLAFLAALAGGSAVLACCALWIGLGWQEGGVAALSAAIFSSLFAFQDDPVPTIGVFLRFILFSLPLSAAYQFFIFQRIDGFPMLVLVLAPSLLACGYFIASPKTSQKALAVTLGLSNSLALTENFNPDFANFANTNVAQIIGILAAYIAAQLCHSVGVDWSARRILRSGWREIAGVAEHGCPDRTQLAVRMLDRVGLLSPRLAGRAPSSGPTAVDALNDVRVGLNIEELHRAQRALDDARPSVRRLLAGVAQGYRGLARAPADTVQGAHRPLLEHGLLIDLDQALEVAARHAPGDAKMRSVACALVSLRRTLFPEAAPYAPMERSA